MDIHFLNLHSGFFDTDIYYHPSRPGTLVTVSKEFQKITIPIHKCFDNLDDAYKFEIFLYNTYAKKDPSISKFIEMILPTSVNIYFGVALCYISSIKFVTVRKP